MSRSFAAGKRRNYNRPSPFRPFAITPARYVVLRLLPTEILLAPGFWLLTPALPAP